MGRLKLLGLIAVMVLGALPALAQGSSPVQYFYDDLGRLTKVVDQSGNLAVYHYDAVGNLLSITRSTLPANNGLSILSFAPQRGTIGQAVTIQGQGFNPTASADAAQFNGTAAAVTLATATTLAVTVPPGATTGPISVTVGGVTVTSDTNFAVLPTALVSITVSPLSSVVSSGSTQQFTAVGTYRDGTTQDLTTSVSWSSSAINVATVSNSAGSQGLVTGVSDGFAAIKATSGPISGFATLRVKVLTNLGITPSNPFVIKGSTQQFAATGVYSDGTILYETGVVTWGSSNPAVATISNAPGSQGLAATVDIGTTTITAQLGSVAASAILSVDDLISIAVTPGNDSIPKGAAQQFTATGTFSDGTTRDVTSIVTWSTSDTSIVLIGNVIGSRGLARAQGVGSATITATSGTISGSTPLTVTAAVPTSIAVTPATGFAPVGGTQKFAATVTMGDGSTQDVTPLAIWTSSDPTIATMGNPEDSEEFATGVAIGTATITATYTGSWGTLTGTAALTVANSVATGVVTFSDETPVPFPDVFISQTDSQGNVQTFFTSATDANGNYWVTNVGLGAFTVIAQDPTSGLNTSVNGTLVTASETATVNVQLPPGGTVSGTVVDATGTPVKNGFVQLFSTGAVLPPADSPFAVNLTTATDASGNYSMSQVSLGEVAVIANQANSGGGFVFLRSPRPYQIAMAMFLPSLFASPVPAPIGGVGTPACGFPCSAYVGASVGTLTAGGQTLTINVTLPATSTIAGTVYASDGVTPVPNAPIIAIENAGIAGGLADFYTNAYFFSSSFSADGSGNFQLNGLPIGSVNVAAASTDLTSAGVATVPLTTSPTTANVVLGNAFSFMNGEYDLTDPAGPIYDVYCDGTVIGGSSGGNNFVHGAAGQLFVNQQPNFCKSSEYGTLDQAGQQITIGPGPRPEGTINVMLGIQRKVYMPASGGYARYLDSFTNPLDVPITTNVLIKDGFDASATPETLLVNPSSNGNSFAILDDTANAASPVFGFVFAGASPSAPVGFFDHSANTNPTVTYQLNQAPGPEFGGGLTIPAHGTITFMHFIIQRTNQDVAGATSLAQSLANMTDPNEFTGMSAQDKSQVVNFNVP